MTSRLFCATAAFFILTVFPGCRDDSQLKINYELGHFPDTVLALEGFNTQYDDYNADIEAARIFSDRQVIFSSNRNSGGSEFDIVQGKLHYSFGQTTGYFQIDAEMADEQFTGRLLTLFNTAGNDFGPLRFFNGRNGLEYMAVSSAREGSGLDLVYTVYIPAFASSPSLSDPVPVTVMNSSSNDAYLSMSITLDTAYFCSDRTGNYDIFMLTRPSLISIDEWFISEPAAAAAVDSIRSSGDDKCPFIRGRYMVFASDMDGGYGGFDLYYSVFRDGKWSSPVNLGPRINTASNEYRPVLNSDLRYENYFLVFSSDRPGGKGGYDLYFAGLDLPQQQ